MTTQPTTAEQFVEDILETAPVAGAYANIAQLRQTGRELQRLQEVLAPLVEETLAFPAPENAQRFHERCAEYLLGPEGSKIPLKQFLTATLLAEAAAPESLQRLAQDLQAITEGVRQAARASSTEPSWAERAQAATGYGTGREV